ATDISVGTGACAGTIGESTLGTTQSMAPCAGTIANDRWYKFVATDTNQIMKLTNGGINNPVVEIFSGTCGALTSIQCINEPWPPTGTSLIREVIKNLVIGQTYYVRVYSGTSPSGAYWLCIYKPESNDEC